MDSSRSQQKHRKDSAHAKADESLQLLLYNPSSLVAFAVKEAAKVYRFSSQDAFSFVRNIDYYPTADSGQSSPEFGIDCDWRLPPEKKQSLFASVNRFLLRRKRLMDAICHKLAKMIVSFEGIEKVEEVKMKILREKYVEYSDVINQLREVDIRVQLEDNIEKLIGHIRKERARVKLINLFVNQTWLKEYEGYGVDELYTAGGDRFGFESLKFGEARDITKIMLIDEAVRDENVRERELDVYNDRGVTDPVVNEDISVNKNQQQAEEIVDNLQEEQEDDDGHHFVLYGMIRCT